MKKHVFSFFRKPAMTTVPYKSIGLVDVYRYIVGHYAARQTAELRRITDEREKKRYKAKAFDYCTFSGVFPFRRDDAMESHSDLLCVDIDKVENVQEVRRMLLGDPSFETMLLFVSPSGNGVKWVIEIDTERASHRQWFEAVSRYLKETYGLEADKACVNESRACFLPNDPECYIAPRLLPEVQPMAEANPEVLNLMETLGAVNVKVESAMESPNKEQNDNERI